MIALVASEKLDGWDLSTLNRILNRTIDPTTNKKIDDLPLIFPSQASRGDVLVAIDEGALYELTGWKGHESLRGYVFETTSPGGIHVVPTYRPERIRKGGWNLAKVVQRDILRGIQVFREGPPRRLDNYVTYPSPEEFAAFMAGWDPLTDPLAFDIETPYSGAKDENMSFDEDPSFTILMVSLAFAPHRSVSVPWSPPFDEMVRTYLGGAARSLVWNAPFDVPRLQANGVNFEGEVVDSMLAWHWLEPGLPMGLKFVAPFYCPEMPAWKLEQDKNFAWYNAADSDTLLRCYLGIKEELEEQQRWETFERHFLEFGKVLRKMGKRGVLVDQESRVEDGKKFLARLGEIEEAVQPHVPEACKPVHPPRGYKTSEEALRKSGKWVEKGMRLLVVELNDKDLLQREKKRERALLQREKRRERARLKEERDRLNDLHREAKKMNKLFNKELKRRKK